MKNLLKLALVSCALLMGSAHAQNKPYMQYEYYTMENRVTKADSEMFMMVGGVATADGWDYALAVGPTQTKLGQSGSQSTFAEARIRKTFAPIGLGIKPYVLGIVGDKITTDTNAWHYLIDAGVIVPLNSRFTGVVGGWYRDAFNQDHNMYQTRWSSSLIFHATKDDSVQLQFAQSKGDSALNQWRLSYKHSF